MQLEILEVGFELDLLSAGLFEVFLDELELRFEDVFLALQLGVVSVKPGNNLAQFKDLGVVFSQGVHLGGQLFLHLAHQRHELGKGVLGHSSMALKVGVESVESVIDVAGLGEDLVELLPAHAPHEPLIVGEVVEVEALRAVMQDCEAEFD